MKLRVNEDSIRLRLTQPEVDRFAAHGRVADTLHFPGGRALTYALVASNGWSSRLRDSLRTKSS